jgi:Putative phage holin Dp-1
MADHAATNSGLVQLSDGQYDLLRRLVQIVIPGLGTLYAAFALLWHWGYIAEVTGSATALSVFGGLLLKAARSGYVPESDQTVTAAVGSYDGQVAIAGVDPDGVPIAQIQLTDDAQRNFLTKPVLTIKGFDESA